MKQQHLSTILLTLSACSSAFAAGENFIISGTIPATVMIKHSERGMGTNLIATAPSAKPISFEHVYLSTEATNYIAAHIDRNRESTNNITPTSSVIPASANIGMNNVPVLDQGQHGTCATFAVTGALDAATKGTDYISQLCNLELGTTLQSESKAAHKKDPQDNPLYPSGWNGSLNHIILEQAQKYGIISMQYQQENGCGNGSKTYTQYPANNQYDTGVPMSENDFNLHHELIMNNITWTPLLKDQDAFSDQSDMDAVVHNVKQAIVNGHRVTFGILIDESVKSLQQINGAAGSNRIANDTWVINDLIAADIKHDASQKDPTTRRIQAGHAMVIIGYDDNAVVTDNDNKKHTGIFTLRNSWSDKAGDSGNYYMSYDYFKTFALDAEEIIPGSAN